ncbi:MAG: serine hydrolase domain-containing protein [Chloroflexota bacterium]
MNQCASEEVGFSSQRLQVIGQQMEKYMAQGTLAGAVSLICLDGKISHFECFGYRDVASQTPMTRDSLFRIYSMTKPVTSAALMVLVEEGIVALHHPVLRFLV